VSTEERPPTEEELRAAYEAELKRLRVEDVLIQTVVSLLNLGGRKAGLVPGSEDEKDLAQLSEAIEGARVLLPLVDGVLGKDARSLQDALSQLQIVYAREVGAGGARPAGATGGPAGAPAEEKPAEQQPGEPGPAQRSGRLWVPGS
jgi:hypothetical protein